MSKRNTKKTIELCPPPRELKPIAMMRLPKDVLRSLKTGEPIKSHINFSEGKITFNTNTFDFSCNEPYTHRCIFKAKGSKAEMMGEALAQIRIDYKSRTLSEAAKEEQMLKSVLAFHQQSVGSQPSTHDPQRIYKPPTQSRSRAPDHDPSSADEYLSSHTGVYSKLIPLKSRLTHLLALDKYMLAPLSIILQEDPLEIRQELDDIAVETAGVYRLNLSEYLNVDVAGFRGYSHKDRIKATGNCHTAFNLARLPSSIPQRRALEAFYGEAGIIPYSTPEALPEEARTKKETKASPKQPQKTSSPLKSLKAVSSSKAAPVARSKPIAASSKASSAKAAARPRVTEPNSSPIDEPRLSGSKSKRTRVESSAQTLSPKRTKKVVLSQEEAPRAILRQTSRNPQEELRVTQKQVSRGHEEDPRATQRQPQRGHEDPRAVRQASRSQNEDIRSNQRQPQRVYEDARPIQRQISRNQEDLRSMQRTRARGEESGTQRQPTLNSRAAGLTPNDGLLHPNPSRSSRHVSSKVMVLGSAFRKLNKEYKNLRTFFLRNRMAIDKHLEEAKSISTNEAKLEDLTKRIKTFVSNAEDASFLKKRARFDDLQSQLLELRKKLNDHLKALAQ